MKVFDGSRWGEYWLDNPGMRKNPIENPGI
jgi:hypothetical protein